MEEDVEGQESEKREKTLRAAGAESLEDGF